MYFQRVEYWRVRNLREAVLEPKSRFCLIHGPNGSGKTALLEGMHITLRARTFRPVPLDSLITQGESDFVVRALLEGAPATASIGVKKASNQSVELRLNRRPIRFISEVTNLVAMQAFQPNFSDLVLGPPRLRREWLDWGVFHEFVDGVSVLREFRQALAQRNAALATGDRAVVASWDQTLAAVSDRLTALRAQYIQRIVPEFCSIMEELNPELGIVIALSTGFSGVSMLQSLEQQIEQDLVARQTRSGPQRADLALRVKSRYTEEHYSARTTLSRGQSKVVATALKIAQIRLLRGGNKAQIYLLDDLDVELDTGNLSRFINFLANDHTQLIVTTTNPKRYAGLSEMCHHSWQEIEINNGVISY